MAEKLYGWGLPIDISTHGHQIDQLIIVIHVLMGILFVGWSIFIILALIKFRKRANHQAEYKPHHLFWAPTYIEVAIAVAEVVLLTAFAFPIWGQLKNTPPKGEGIELRVVAEQFAWNVHYPGKDGIFGKTDPKLMNAANPLGLDSSDPAGKDDVTTLNQLHIPVDTPVTAHLSSKDVIHSFALTVMRIKQDMIPGHSIPVWFQATRTGDFEIACAQLCGLGHYRMRGFFVVQTKEKFAEWLDAELAKKEGAES